MKEEGGGGRRGGRKGWPYRRLLPPADTQALWNFTLGLQRREDWNSALPEIRPDQNQNSSSLPRGGEAVKLTQLCPTLCDPMDCSLPCSSVRRILQARILEWVAISFSRRSSQPRDRTRQTLYHLSHQGSFQEEVISLQSSAQAEALRPDSCVQDRGTRKTGKDRKG